MTLCGTQGLAHATPTFTVASTPARLQGLTAMSADSATDVWGVGQGPSPEFPTVHFNGSSWTKFADVVASNDTTHGSQLNGVAAISPTNAWGVGTGGIAGTASNFTGFIEHWNGTSWSLTQTVSFSAVGGDAELNAVAKTSASDVWAVGTFAKSDISPFEPLVEHFDGTSWTQVTTEQKSATFTTLRAVSARTTTDAWAVGITNPDDGSGDAAITMHWNGTSWSFVRSAISGVGDDEMQGVVAPAADDVWAVGTTVSPTGTAPDKTFIEHFDGTSWTQASSPNLVVNGVTQGCDLNAVTAVSATDIWAVGFCRDPVNTFPQVTFALHYDGAAWSIVSTPNPAPQSGFPTNDLLFGATSLPDGHLWFGGVNGSSGLSAAGSTGIVLQATGG